MISVCLFLLFATNTAGSAACNFSVPSPRNLTLNIENFDYFLRWDPPQIASEEKRDFTYTVYKIDNAKEASKKWIKLPNCENLVIRKCHYEVENVLVRFGLISVVANDGSCSSAKSEAQTALSPLEQITLKPPEFKAKYSANNRLIVILQPDWMKGKMQYLFISLIFQVEVSEMSKKNILTRRTVTAYLDATEVDAGKCPVNPNSRNATHCCVKIRFYDEQIAKDYALGRGEWSQSQCFNVSAPAFSSSKRIPDKAVSVAAVVIGSVLFLFVIVLAIYKSWKFYIDVYKSVPPLPASLIQVMKESQIQGNVIDQKVRTTKKENEALHQVNNDAFETESFAPLVVMPDNNNSHKTATEDQNVFALTTNRSYCAYCSESQMRNLMSFSSETFPSNESQISELNCTSDLNQLSIDKQFERPKHPRLSTHSSINNCTYRPFAVTQDKNRLSEGDKDECNCLMHHHGDQNLFDAAKNIDYRARLLTDNDEKKFLDFLEPSEFSDKTSQETKSSSLASSRASNMCASDADDSVFYPDSKKNAEPFEGDYISDIEASRLSIGSQNISFKLLTNKQADSGSSLLSCNSSEKESCKLCTSSDDFHPSTSVSTEGDQFELMPLPSDYLKITEVKSQTFSYRDQIPCNQLNDQTKTDENIKTKEIVL